MSARDPWFSPKLSPRRTKCHKLKKTEEQEFRAKEIRKIPLLTLGHKGGLHMHPSHLFNPEPIGQNVCNRSIYAPLGLKKFCRPTNVYIHNECAALAWIF